MPAIIDSSPACITTSGAIPADDSTLILQANYKDCPGYDVGPARLWADGILRPALLRADLHRHFVTIAVLIAWSSLRTGGLSDTSARGKARG